MAPIRSQRRRRSDTTGGAAPSLLNGTVEGLDALLPALSAGGGGLLGDVALYVRQYVVVTPAQLVAIALWVVHTHAIMAAEQTPYLVITSPEKQCGKSRLMEVLRVLVAREWYVITPSEPVLYRTIHARRPTLLLDEVDAIFNPRSADKHEGLRALINAGNRKGATVPRCVGNTSKVHDFSVYSAKALAAIGTLPDTITDRSLPIRLKRKTRAERVQRFRVREAETPGHALRDQLAAWGEEHELSLAEARPTIPDELSDRMQDASEPLLAIADVFGGSWPPLARLAMVELCTGERQDDAETARVNLLTDIKKVFLDAGARRMSTTKLLSELWLIPESPWSTWYGRTLDARDLAKMLEPFGVHSQNVKMKGGAVAKGYRREPLEDAWRRYVDASE